MNNRQQLILQARGHRQEKLDFLGKPSGVYSDEAIADLVDMVAQHYEERVTNYITALNHNKVYLSTEERVDVINRELALVALQEGFSSE